MKKAKKLLKEIDLALTSQQETSLRRHLGASLIGADCSRAIWYSFRWALNRKLSARILRLFSRGHKEEDTFNELLSKTGAEVHSKDEDGNQYKVGAIMGHFGGSVDGIGFNVEGREEAILLEYKTANDKNFKELVKKGVALAQQQHYAQMQVYMLLLNLKKALYWVVNKNDDDYHAEYVEFNEKVAKFYLKRARRIITANNAPFRIDERPGYFICKYFCDFTDICHHKKPALVNCRTCAYSKPVEDKEWYCSRYDENVPDFIEESGCESHIYREGMLNFDIVEKNLKKGYYKFKYKTDDGVERTFKNGKKFVTSYSIYKNLC